MEHGRNNVEHCSISGEGGKMKSLMLASHSAHCSHENERNEISAASLQVHFALIPLYFLVTKADAARPDVHTEEIYVQCIDFLLDFTSILWQTNRRIDWDRPRQSVEQDGRTKWNGKSIHISIDTSVCFGVRTLQETVSRISG